MTLSEWEWNLRIRSFLLGVVELLREMQVDLSPETPEEVAAARRRRQAERALEEVDGVLRRGPIVTSNAELSKRDLAILNRYRLTLEVKDEPVRPLRASALYALELALPAQVRAWGRWGNSSREMPPGVHAMSWTQPGGFSKPVDDLIKPAQASRTVRINLAFTDAAIIEQMGSFLKAERQRLALLPGTGGKVGAHPSLEAAMKAKARNRPQPKVFAKSGLLQYLDLQRWCPTAKVKQLATLIQSSDVRVAVTADLKVTREQASRCADYQELISWFA